MVCSEICAGVRVVRTFIYPNNTGFLLRLLEYFSFVFSSVALGAWHIGRPDVVVTESPPLFLGLAGLFLSWLTGARHVLNVSDLWPQSAVELGVVRNPQLLRLATMLEEFLYRRSDMITGQTRGIVESIKGRFPAKELHLLTNGVDCARFSPRDELQKAEARRRFGLPQDAFIVGYAGLHGLMQGLESLMDAAALLQPERDIWFALFGDGPVKARLLELARTRGLENTRFFPTQPEADMPGLMNALDVSLVPLKRVDLCRGALPSKLFASLGAGVAVVAAADGEARDLLQRAKGGLAVEPENAHEIAAAILRLYREPKLRAACAASGQAYVREHYDRQKIAAYFEQLLQGMIPPSQTAAGQGRFARAEAPNSAD